MLRYRGLCGIKLMEELLETAEILCDPEMMKNIHEGQEDIKAGRVKQVHTILKGVSSRFPLSRLM